MSCKKSPRNNNWKLKTLQYCCALPNTLEASLRQYIGAGSIVPSLVLTQRFIYVRGDSVVEVSRIRSIFVITSKKETLQVIRRVLPICQVIAYSFCFTWAETEIHKNKEDSKTDREKNIDHRGPSQIGTV